MPIGKREIAETANNRNSLPFIDAHTATSEKAAIKTPGAVIGFSMLSVPDITYGLIKKRTNQSEQDTSAPVAPMYFEYLNR
jgi:hypothetical protein